MTKKRNNAIGPNVREKKHAPLAVPLFAVFAFVLGLQVATQFYAWTVHYAESLGANFAHLYAPWSIIDWTMRWSEVDSEGFVKAGSVGMAVTAILLLLIAVYGQLQRNSTRTNEFLHGSARWANRADLEKAGLLSAKPTMKNRRAQQDRSEVPAVYVGSWVDEKGEQHYLRHAGPEHVLCIAPTRSGKGVGLVLPTLLSWPASAVVTDLKGELWALTAGWRAKYAGNKVLRFEPAADLGSVRWNPLDEIRLGTQHEVGDVQNLATLIVDPDGRGLETHWQKTSQALLVGLLLHVLYLRKIEGKPATLAGVDRTLSDPSREIGDLWAEMTLTSHLGDRAHPVIESAARDMLDRPEEEAGSVLSTAKSYLALYRDPIVAANTSRSDFRIHNLMHHTDPVSLYIVTQANDKLRLRPLVRVLVNMVVRLNADGLTFEDGRPIAHYKHRLLVMLDEFPSLGKLEILQESLAFLAGFGLKCYLICQDLTQLKSRELGYGHDESITSNCHVQTAFPPNRVETAEYLSKMTGQTTVTRQRVTTSGARLAVVQGQVSITSEETQRPLLTVDECLRMPGPTKDDEGSITTPGDMLIYAAGCPAIYGRQPLYFQDPVFLARARIPAPEQSQRVKAETKAVELEL